MSGMPRCADGLSAVSKYGNRFLPFKYPSRKWPDAVLQKAPALLSTDLRDGNQALPVPMTEAQKLRMLEIVVSMGFEEIEIAFPSANSGEFDFGRSVVETPGLIPDHILVQVLTPCHEHAIRKAVECVQGAKQAMIFMYLPSSDCYRDTILGISEDEWVARACKGVAYLRSITIDDPRMTKNTQWKLGFGFEDFASARPSAILRCAEAIIAVWNPSDENKMDIGVASSLEVSTPNIFADKVEYLSRGISRRSAVRLSVHTHNDRGCAVAAGELACLAGADRIEGCLFGNGERAGNLDLITFAGNLLTQGIDPKLCLSQLPDVRREFEAITSLAVPKRSPYAGAFYFRAFSGGHQDAITKGLRRRDACAPSNEYWPSWRVPYLPLDPADVGCSIREHVMGINSQSGKQGIRWAISFELGLDVPLELARSFSSRIKELSLTMSREISAEQVCMVFSKYFGLDAACQLKEHDCAVAAARGLHGLRILSATTAALSEFSKQSITRFGDILKNASKGTSSKPVLIPSPDACECSSEGQRNVEFIAYLLVQVVSGNGTEGTTLWAVGLGNDLEKARAHAILSVLGTSRSAIMNTTQGSIQATQTSGDTNGSDLIDLTSCSSARR